MKEYVNENMEFMPKGGSYGVKEEAICFIFQENKFLVLNREEGSIFPNFKEVKELGVQIENLEMVGSLSGRDYYSCEMKECYKHKAQEVGLGLKDVCFRDLRSLIAHLDENTFKMCSRASLLHNWNKNNRFCGRCGSHMTSKNDEKAKVCTGCGYIVYPRISPAIIVAITRNNGEELLLAHNKNFPEKRYSIIAGFVEAGESFEDTVRREVFEEVGIKVKNIKYYGSQLWPFPDSMMVGFTAEYESGKIKVDNEEILHADFF